MAYSGNLEDGPDLAGRKIEQPDVAIGWLVAEAGAEIAAGRDRLAVRRDGDGEDLAVIAGAHEAAQRADRRPGLPVPDADRLVVRRRDQVLAVASECDVLDEGAVAARIEIEGEIGRFRIGRQRNRRQPGQQQRCHPSHPRDVHRHGLGSSHALFSGGRHRAVRRHISRSPAHRSRRPPCAAFRHSRGNIARTTAA